MQNDYRLVCRFVYGSVYLWYCIDMKSARRTGTVRISPRAHQLLRQLAKNAGESMQSILDKSVETYRREEFLRAANRDYAALRRNPKGWREELRERALWEQTSADGLEKK